MHLIGAKNDKIFWWKDQCKDYFYFYPFEFNVDVKNLTITSHLFVFEREMMGINKLSQYPKTPKLQHFTISNSGKAITLETAKPLLIKSFQRYYRFSQRQTKVSIFFNTLTVPLFWLSTSRGVAVSLPGNHHQGNLTYLSMPASHRLTAGLSIS